MLPSENFLHDTIPPATCNRQLVAGALPCDAWHHYYHYQSSAQYLLLARICLAMDLGEEAGAALQKALFQDHFNDAALALKAQGAQAVLPYRKHPARDAVFRASLELAPDPATALHDGAVTLKEDGALAQAALLLRTAIAISPQHSNSHFTLAQCCFEGGEYSDAREHALAAIRLSHQAHDAYHRFASAQHLDRGRGFAGQGEWDLAINAFTKALDLFQGNDTAREARDEAYRKRDEATERKAL